LESSSVSLSVSTSFHMKFWILFFHLSHILFHSFLCNQSLYLFYQFFFPCKLQKEKLTQVKKSTRILKQPLSGLTQVVLFLTNYSFKNCMVLLLYKHRLAHKFLFLPLVELTQVLSLNISYHSMQPRVILSVLSLIRLASLLPLSLRQLFDLCRRLERRTQFVMSLPLLPPHIHLIYLHFHVGFYLLHNLLQI